jgi:hypothetical protein
MAIISTKHFAILERWGEWWNAVRRLHGEMEHSIFHRMEIFSPCTNEIKTFIIRSVNHQKQRTLTIDLFNNYKTKTYAFCSTIVRWKFLFVITRDQILTRCHNNTAHSKTVVLHIFRGWTMSVQGMLFNFYSEPQI